MGELDLLGKRLLRVAAGHLCDSSSAACQFSLGLESGTATIDGTVAGMVAVEIESRTPKQIRGALLDLLLHPFPKKLLIILPVHCGNERTALNQATSILGRYVEQRDFRVVCASLTEPEETIAAIRSALCDLGVTELIART